MSDLYELHVSPFKPAAATDTPGKVTLAFLPAGTRIESITGLDRVDGNVVIYVTGPEPTPLDVDVWVTDGIGGRRRIV